MLVLLDRGVSESVAGEIATRLRMFGLSVHRTDSPNIRSRVAMSLATDSFTPLSSSTSMSDTAPCSAENKKPHAVKRRGRESRWVRGSQRTNVGSRPRRA